MSPAWIRVRENSDGSKSFQVLYRRGGRHFRIETAGTFRGWPGGKKQGRPAAALTAAQDEAKTRRDLVAGWIAQGLNPRDELARISADETLQRKTPERWRDDWIVSLHDVSSSTRRTYAFGISAVFKLLKVADLREVAVADCERIVGELSEKYAPKTVWTYWTAFALLLDYVGVDPNPATNRRVKLPKQVRVPVNPPTDSHFEAMVTRVAKKYVLPMVLIERTAVRVETIETLDWATVDVAGSRFRTTEKGRKTRWVEMSPWLTRAVIASAPAEDRDGRVFPNVTAAGLRQAMRTACKHAGIPHYHPHDLRHRRASLWHLQGIPDAVLADRVGHERSTFTKNVYVHVMPVGEISDERLEAIVEGALA